MTPHALLVLPDGRKLAYLELGDPSGQPLLYCHGFPASRLEARLAESAAAAAGLRVLSPDRPGYGRSDFAPGRSLLGWAEDVRVLADTLGLERFAVLGVSGGGPYALACADRLGDRLARLGLVCPLGPVDRPHALEPMRYVARIGLRLAREWPASVPLWYGALARLLAGRHPELTLALLSRVLPEVDRAVLREPGVRALLADSLREAFRQGGRGPSWDLALYARPWGIDLEALAMPVRLWHGGLDATLPVSMGRDLARRIPGCEAIFPPDEGHFSLPIRHIESILSWLGGGEARGRDLGARGGGGTAGSAAR